MVKSPIQKRWINRGRGKDEAQLVANYENTIAGNKLSIPLVKIGGHTWGFCFDGGTLHPAVIFLIWLFTRLSITPWGILEEVFLRHDYRWAQRASLKTGFVESNRQLQHEAQAVLSKAYPDKPKRVKTASWLLYAGTTWFGWVNWIVGYFHTFSWHYSAIPKDVINE